MTVSVRTAALGMGVEDIDLVDRLFSNIDRYEPAEAE